MTSTTIRKLDRYVSGPELSGAIQSLDRFFNGRQWFPVEIAIGMADAAAAYQTLLAAYRQRKNEAISARGFVTAWQRESEERWRLQKALENQPKFYCRKRLLPLAHLLVRNRGG